MTYKRIILWRDEEEGGRQTELESLDVKDLSLGK